MLLLLVLRGRREKTLIWVEVAEARVSNSARFWASTIANGPQIGKLCKGPTMIARALKFPLRYICKYIPITKISNYKYNKFHQNPNSSVTKIYLQNLLIFSLRIFICFIIFFYKIFIFPIRHQTHEIVELFICRSMTY